MPSQVKNLDIPLPNRLPAKNFMHRRRAAMDSAAVVQMLNAQFDTFQVFSIIRHSVRQAPRLSTRFSQRQPLERASYELRRAFSRSCTTRN